MSLSPSTEGFDLGSSADQDRVRQLADQLADVPETELRQIGSDDDAGISLRLASKLALSRQALRRSSWTGRLGVVFGMWGEQRRLRPRSRENPAGEDSLHTKLDQLDWLFQGTAVDWHLYPTDDGDPDDSAAVAERRAATHRLADHVTVLRLSEAVPAESGPLRHLASVDDSRKGGAVVLGATRALEDGCDAIVMTDADNSVNLGQAGLLVDPFSRGTEVAIGDRKHPEAILVKAEARWGPGIVVLRHMQRMVGRALFSRGLRDTQAAFKLYGRAALTDILDDPSTYGFAFDSDWLYGAIAGGHSIETVPFAFVDSFEESASLAQGPMTTWESLLRGLVAAARARGVDHDEEMAAVVDDHASAGELERVVREVPRELQHAGDEELGKPELMSPQQLRAWLETLR